MKGGEREREKEGGGKEKGRKGGKEGGRGGERGRKGGREGGRGKGEGHSVVYLLVTTCYITRLHTFHKVFSHVQESWVVLHNANVSCA